LDNGIVDELSIFVKLVFEAVKLAFDEAFAINGADLLFRELALFGSKGIAVFGLVMNGICSNCNTG
jgi:hypothetical protein